MDEARSPMTRLVSRAWDQAKTPLYRNAFFIMLTGVITNGLGFLFWFLVIHGPGSSITPGRAKS